jgi:hypothetical protein
MKQTELIQFWYENLTGKQALEQLESGWETYIEMVLK